MFKFRIRKSIPKTLDSKLIWLQILQNLLLLIIAFLINSLNFKGNEC